MAGLDVNTKAFSQHLDAGTLRDNDLILIAQPWAPGLAGYKTVNINLRTTYNVIRDSLKEQGIPPELIANGGGLLGTGTEADPLRLSQKWIMDNYAVASLTNVSQIGRLDRTTLPISAAATAFSFPMNGRSMAAFTAPNNVDGGFDTLVPVTNGFATTYNYGSGELFANDMVDYRTTETQYMPRLPDGYDSADYYIEQIFSCSKNYMVAKLRHAWDSDKDELVVIRTDGTLNGASHFTYVLTENNLYRGSVISSLDVNRVESKLKYTAFEQGGKLYITRFDITPTDKAIGNDPTRNVGLIIYQLVAQDQATGYKLTPLPVRDIVTTFMGARLAGGVITTLTSGYSDGVGSELDLSIAPKGSIEFKAIPLTGNSQAMDRFLDVSEPDDGVVCMRLSRTANFYLTRTNGTRQEFIVNYGYSYNIDMVNKTITSIETDPIKHKPKLVLDGTIYSVAMNKQEATLWNGATGRIEARCECNLTITTPTTSLGNSIVTQRDNTTGEAIISGGIEIIDRSAATITPEQYDVPLSSGSLDAGQELMFLTGTENNGYLVGGLKIAGADQPTHTYTDAKGEVMHGYSLDLERFNEQRFVNGVDLDSYATVYNCREGQIFNSVDGYENTTSKTRFGVLEYTYAELGLGVSKSFIQHTAEMVFSEDGVNKSTVITEPVDVYVDHRAIAEWIKANVGYVEQGIVKLVPFTVNGRGKVFIHMTLVGGIGVGLLTIHLIADADLNDEDIIVGAVEQHTVNINTISYNGKTTANYEQPQLYNISIFVEDVSGKIAILYGNLGEYTYDSQQSSNRAYMLNFGMSVDLRNLPYSTSFGLVTYYLDKVNGVSFTGKDSWLQIMQTSEQLPISYVVPRMARSGAMLLAAPTAQGVGVVKILEPIPFFLGGVNGFVPVQDVIIPSIAAVTTQYVYLGLRNSLPYIEVRPGGTAERPDYTLIAIVKTSPSITISSEPFIRLGTYRLSTTKKGTAIPVTAPHPAVEQFTLWD